VIGAGDRRWLLHRTGEIAVLETAVRAPSERRQAVVTIRGEPGTGRTELLRLAADRAERAGVRAVRVAGFRAERELPWGLIRRAFPELTERAPADVSAICAAVLAQAREAPLALLIDDVQWCDRESAAVVCTLARRIRQAPLAVVTADNGTCPHPADQVAALPAEIHTVVRVPPISRAAVHAMCRAHFGAEPDPDFTTAVWRAGGGLPAVIVPALIEYGTPSTAPDTADFADLVRRHRAVLIGRVLDSLPESAVETLRYIAVSGGVDDHCAVRAVVGNQAAERTLYLLTRCGLVRDDIGFRPSDGVTDVVLAGMDTADRRALAAAAAAHAHQVCASDDVVGRILLDTDPVAAPWAARVLERAATGALHSGVDGDAVLLLERLLREPLHPAHRARVQVDLAAVEAVVRPAATDRVLRQVLAGAGLGADQRRAADLLLVRGEPGAIRSAVRSLTAPGDAARSGLDGLTRLMACAVAAADGPWSPPALPPDNRSGDGTDWGGPAVAAAMAWAFAAAGEELDRAVELARSAVADQAAATGSNRGLASPVLAAGMVLALADDNTGAVAAFTSVLADAERRPMRVIAATAALCLAVAALRAGRPDTAAAHLVRIDGEVRPQAQSAGLRRMVRAIAVLVDLRRGRLDSAQRRLAEAAEIHRAGEETGRGVGDACLAYARAAALLAGRRPREAMAAAYECGRWLGGRGLRTPTLLPWRSLAADAAVMLGDRETVRELIEAEVVAARGWETPTVLGRLHLLRAAVADGAGRIEQLGEAERLLRSSPDRLLHAETGIALAEALIAAGRAEEAAVLLDTALVAARAGGAIPLLERIATVRPSDPPIRPMPTVLVPAGLTRSQARVVALAASGLSNPEIAHVLGVTRRAVEMHLSAAYRSLRVRGRAELPRGLFDTDPDPSTVDC
jgi:DNA-binding CsgD family transcriptional regulator